MVIIGSYVPKSSVQLDALLQVRGVNGLKLCIEKILKVESRNQYIDALIMQVNSCLLEGKNTVVYTSRELVTGTDNNASILIGQQVSSVLVEILRGVDIRPRCLIVKGGITSSDLATKALEVKAADFRAGNTRCDRMEIGHRKSAAKGVLCGVSGQCGRR